MSLPTETEKQVDNDTFAGRTRSEPFRPQALTLVQVGLFLLLLLLLLLFEHSGRFLVGGLAFMLLIGCHFYIDSAINAVEAPRSRRAVMAVIIYLLLCSLVVWLTRGEEESPLWIVFFLPIIVAASSFGLRGTVLTCGAALLLFIAHLPPHMYLQPQTRVEELPEMVGFGVMFFSGRQPGPAFRRQRRLQLQRTQQLNRQLLEKQRHLEQSLEQLETAEKTLRAKERLASLGELSAGIAHEIRNPLGIISSSAQLLGNEFTAKGARQLLDIIQEESTRLNGLITDFLFFGRRLEPQYCDCDLAALVERTSESLRPAAEQNGVRLSFDNACRCGICRCDPAMIQQVLLNLLLNALDATAEEGSINVAMRCDGPDYEITVSDNGCGIAEEYRDRVFDPFFTTKGTGTGLGLANSYKIAQSHGGDLMLKNRDGRGTTFALILPAQDS